MQLGDLLDQRSPLGHCRATRPFAVRLSRRGKRLLHLFVGRGRVLLHYVPARGVDHCIPTQVTPLISEIRCVHCNGIAETPFPVLVVCDATAPLATEVRAASTFPGILGETAGRASIPTDEEARRRPMGEPVAALRARPTPRRADPRVPGFQFARLPPAPRRGPPDRSDFR